MSVFSTIGTVAEAKYLQDRPLPTAPDGRYDAQAAPTTDGKAQGHSKIYNLMNTIDARIKSGPIITADPQVVAGFIDLVKNKDSGINDRLGIFNTGLATLSKLPPGLPIAKTLNDGAISLLYNNLGHPPSNYIAPANTFREADGGSNNLMLPDVGRAGTPYARSVQGRHPLPLSALPDPGLVFDVLLKRRTPKPHPGGNSSMTFAFAAIITHSLFRTNPRDWTYNETSSYLDLSPLYGVNQAQQDSVRVKDGRGMLAPDAFAEERLSFAPPAMSALLVIFSRNHNYIAKNLYLINERKKWVDPKTFPAPTTNADGETEYDAQMLQQDNEIFNTARLVNCGHFMGVVFGDYVSGFLGLGRDGNSWSMDPFSPIKNDDGSFVGRGEGNHVSVEFNLLYRWHATLSESDEKWTEKVITKAFNGKPFDQITMEDFGGAIKAQFATVDADPKTRTFHGLVRDPVTGRFSDKDIADILQDSTESMASAYRGRGTPACLRPIEIMSMIQARKWNVCTMNEFRTFLGLKRFETFAEWNSDKEIALAAEQLYGHIDNLELYPGVQAEETMPLGPGSGFCAGYTLTRAILADAISLVRGDRFFTTDFTPANLTSWGFQDCARDPNNGAFGAALPKLLFRHLPLNYTYNNTYALFPFFTPATMEANLTKLGLASKYEFTRPPMAPIPKVLNTMKAIRSVFGNSQMYKTIYERDMRFLTQGYGYFLVFEDAVNHEKDKQLVMHALLPNPAALNAYAAYYRDTTRKLIIQKSYRMDGAPGRFIDIISQVINVVSVHWAAEKLCGIPLKTPENPNGMFTEQEVYDMFAVLFSCVFRNVDPSVGWVLRNAAEKVGNVVTKFIEKNLQEVMTQPGFFGSVSTAVKNVIYGKSNPDPSHEFLSRLAASGRPLKDLSANVMGLAVGSSVNYAQACAQVVNFYLDDKYAKEREHIIALSKSADPAADALIMGYIREAQRLEPQFGGLFRDATADGVIQQGGDLPDITVKKGDRIFASYKNAHMNPDDYPNPDKVDPSRVTDSVQAVGFHACPGVGYVEKTMPQIVKVIFSLPNLRRAPGPQGQLASFMVNAYGTDNRVYINPNGGLTPWPGSLLLQFDD